MNIHLGGLAQPRKRHRPKLLPAVFDLLSQGSRTVERPGAYDGLELVREVVKLRGCRRAKEGSTFTVQLSLTNAPLKALSNSDATALAYRTVIA